MMSELLGIAILIIVLTLLVQWYLMSIISKLDKIIAFLKEQREED